MADFNKPALTDLYQNFLAFLKDRDVDLAKMFDGTASTNLPVGTVRWNSGANRFELWSGTAWGPLTAQYAIDVATLGGQTSAFHRNAANLNAGILPAARFNNTTHGVRSGGTQHALATPTAHGFMASTDKSKLNGIETGATADQTAAEILAAVKTVDGAGSGLDADTLDGSHASTFAAAGHTHGAAASYMVRKHNATQAITSGNNAPKTVLFATQVDAAGTDISWNGSSFIPAVAGLYLITVAVQWNGLNGNGWRWVEATTFNKASIAHNLVLAQGNLSIKQTATGLRELAAGESVTALVGQNSGATLNLSFADHTYFSIYKLA